jgi:hypothetical protein
MVGALITLQISKLGERIALKRRQRCRSKLRTRTSFGSSSIGSAAAQMTAFRRGMPHMLFAQFPG